MASHGSKSGGGGSGGTLKVNGGVFNSAKVPVLERGTKGSTKYSEYDGYVMNVNGVPVYLKKNEYGNGYTMSAYGMLAKSYESKREMLANSVRDAQSITSRLGDTSMLKAQLEAIQKAGSVSPQKLAAIRRKIQNDARKSK